MRIKRLKTTKLSTVIDSFSAMQDVAVHKDRQRRSLLDWENDLMFKIFSGQGKFLSTAIFKISIWFMVYT